MINEKARGKSSMLLESSLPIVKSESLSVMRGENLVFHHLSFALFPGTLTALQGKNGSGKTTLLKTIAGLLPILEGSLKTPPQHLMRIAFLTHGLEGFLTVQETLSFWGEIFQESKEGQEKRKVHYQLESLSHRLVQELSFGQQQRLNLALLGFGSSVLWLIDEPLAGLDESAVSLFKDDVFSFVAQGGGVLFSTHGETLDGKSILL